MSADSTMAEGACDDFNVGPVDDTLIDENLVNALADVLELGAWTPPIIMPPPPPYRRRTETLQQQTRFLQSGKRPNFRAEKNTHSTVQRAENCRWRSRKLHDQPGTAAIASALHVNATSRRRKLCDCNA